MTLSDLQWPAMALSLLGAVLVASSLRQRRRAGFGVWVGSNLLWVVWGLNSAAWGFVVMQLAFIATSVAGWWNSRARP
jgi:hypothetical protein